MRTVGQAKPYIGRFAPSPTGPLHAGSLVAALASWLDAKAHKGTWLLRIEDLDTQRCSRLAHESILSTLKLYGMHWDGRVEVQTQRTDRYLHALNVLIDKQGAYACGCARRAYGIYPGTCRNGLPLGAKTRAWRFALPNTTQSFEDRWIGVQTENSACTVGDFVLKRADGFWAYQLAVVVDDAEQGITDVVRGDDLLDSTVRQIHLQQALGYPRPRYLHVPVLKNTAGEKLSKQTLAPALSLTNPMPALRLAAAHLGLTEKSLLAQVEPQAFLEAAVPLWAARLFSLRPTTSPPAGGCESPSA